MKEGQRQTMNNEPMTKGKKIHSVEELSGRTQWKTRVSILDVVSSRTPFYTEVSSCVSLSLYSFVSFTSFLKSFIHSRRFVQVLWSIGCRIRHSEMGGIRSVLLSQFRVEERPLLPQDKEALESQKPLNPFSREKSERMTFRRRRKRQEETTKATNATMV